ncbi:MAG: thioredoxin domain-containing protein [Syntrophorhabdales bacterium]|jgi:thiol:disulfide interchange protein DsbA|nr:thioredoxin domain-containing protein [Syntrophorhabdales bacterium]
MLSIFLTVFFLTNTSASAQADEKKGLLTSFGNGKIIVRLYADYFCGPCSLLEPKLEGIVERLVKKNIVNLTFIDVPFYKHSSLYVRYFLYALNEKKTLEHTFKVRTVLFNAAKEKITEPSALEDYLNKNDIKIKPFDTRHVYDVFERYMNKEDKINATPSCVILKGDKKETYKGAAEILKSLESLE